ncbi:MAG: hypothetical protein M3Q87_02375, partial [Actinomycetota bacterium]|nr:hypothetical protein [Actinomycetota bacterium]
MRSFLANVSAAMLVSAALMTPPANGAPAASRVADGFEIVDGRWSVTATFQTFSAADAATESSNDSTSGLALDDSDPTGVVLLAGREFTFYAPEASGRPLREGFYGIARSTVSTDPNRPQMSVEYVEESCPGDPTTGSFDVRELH